MFNEVPEPQYPVEPAGQAAESQDPHTHISWSAPPVAAVTAPQEENEKNENENVQEEEKNISREDLDLFTVVEHADDAVDVINKFYSKYLLSPNF